MALEALCWLSVELKGKRSVRRYDNCFAPEGTDRPQTNVPPRVNCRETGQPQEHRQVPNDDRIKKPVVGLCSRGNAHSPAFVAAIRDDHGKEARVSHLDAIELDSYLLGFVAEQLASRG